MDEWGIELGTTQAYYCLAEVVGLEAANAIFDEEGLNDDDTWAGKDEEAWALVEKYGGHVPPFDTIQIVELDVTERMPE